MRVGVATLGDHLPDPRTGQRVSTGERFREFVELGVAAERLGYHAYHVGEHHFCEYVLSSPTPILAAVAERTSSIRLSTAVALLPNHDPVRIAEDYATVDLISGGRVEVVGGRGVFNGLYDQYGQDHTQSAALLDEAVRLLVRLWTEENLTWTGSIRPPLSGITLHPRPAQQPHPPIWISTSSEESVDRAVELGCGMMVATISTGVERQPALVERYRAAWRASGRDPSEARVGLHLHGYVGDGTTAEARDRWAIHQRSYLQWVFDLVRPGLTLPPHLAELDHPQSQAVCGSVDDVTTEVQSRLDAVGGVDLLLIQTDQGGLPYPEVVASLERFATQVVPGLRP
jgi:alkanesulfonate monooxygenase SsuD/methylene tetrahydromethanopterin reductase-like flavin-dependent oxidoreductase (luciferase family)